MNAINRIDGLPVTEDDMVEFGVADDTASDLETRVCWDIDGTLDADSTAR